MRAEGIHLTLVLLGEMRVSQLDILHFVANTVREKNFSLLTVLAIESLAT